MITSGMSGRIEKIPLLPCEHLACDGPSNGLYIGHEQATSEGYLLEQWPTGEFVWMRPDV